MDLPAGRSRFVWPLLAAVVAGLVYANSVGNEFALDDLPLVRDNPDIRATGELPALLLKPYWPLEGTTAGLYRPLTMLSFGVNGAIAGWDPLGFHVVNVALHAAVCALAWFALRRAGSGDGAALLAALLFAVHPLHTEAVANVVGRAELWGALWVLAAWVAHRRATEPAAARIWGFAAIACYLLALLSKENTVLAPALFLLDDLLRKRRGLGGARAGAAIWAGYAVALASTLLLRVQALGGLRGAENVAFIDNPAAFAALPVRLATALWVQVLHFRQFLWPAQLSSDYSFDAIPLVQNPLDPRLWAGLLWVCGLPLLFLVGWRRSRALALGIAIWTLFFLPGANLLFPAGTMLAERLAYLPSLGACLIVGHLFAPALLGSGRDGGRRRGIVAVAIVAVLGLLAARTVSRNPDWHDNLTLARVDAETVPRSAKLHAGVGIFSHADGNAEAAESAFRRALEIYPDYAQTRFNLGQLLVTRGADAEAIEHLTRAAEISPDNPRPFLSLAPLLERAGRRQEALRAYAVGSRLAPRNLPFRFNYGRLLLSAGMPEEARAVFEGLVRDAPSGIVGGVATGMLEEIDARPERAREIYRVLLEDPQLPPGVRSRILERMRGLKRPGEGG